MKSPQPSNEFKVRPSYVRLPQKQNISHTPPQTRAPETKPRGGSRVRAMTQPMDLHHVLLKGTYLHKSRREEGEDGGGERGAKTM